MYTIWPHNSNMYKDKLSPSGEQSVYQRPSMILKPFFHGSLIRGTLSNSDNLEDKKAKEFRADDYVMMESGFLSPTKSECQMSSRGDPWNRATMCGLSYG